MKAYVWDQLNHEEEDARTQEVVHFDVRFTSLEQVAIEAAERYAEEDEDGHTDDLYSTGQPLCVRLLDEGLGIDARFVVEVTMELTPSYHGVVISKT